MKTIFVSLLIAGLFMYPVAASAQFDDGGSGNEENGLGSGHSPRDLNENTEEKSLDFDQRGPTEVPFDGGVSALLIAGAAYGVKKAARRAKNKKLVSKEK